MRGIVMGARLLPSPARGRRWPSRLRGSDEGRAGTAPKHPLSPDLPHPTRLRRATFSRQAGEGARSIIALLLILFGTFAAHADPAGLATIVQDLGKDSFSATNKAVVALGTSGDPRAATILGALKDEHLVFDPDNKRIVYATVAGRCQFDAKTRSPESRSPGSTA